MYAIGTPVQITNPASGRFGQVGLVVTIHAGHELQYGLRFAGTSLKLAFAASEVAPAHCTQRLVAGEMSDTCGERAVSVTDWGAPRCGTCAGWAPGEIMEAFGS